MESEYEQTRIEKSLQKVELFWMAFRGLWRGQGAPGILQLAEPGPQGGVGEDSVYYIYIRTQGLRGRIKVSEGTYVGSTRQRHKASADFLLAGCRLNPTPLTIEGTCTRDRQSKQKCYSGTCCARPSTIKVDIRLLTRSAMERTSSVNGQFD